MLDVEVALQRLEEARSAHGAGNEGDEVGASLQGVVRRVEHRGQLDRLVAGLPAGPEVANRAHAVLSGEANASVERSDSELIDLARQQIDSMRQRARDQIEPAAPDVEPFERLATLPIVVADHRNAPGDRYCVDYGLGSVASAGVLSPRDVDDIAEAEMSWPIYNEKLEPQWNQVASAFARIAEDNNYLVRWILAPATHGALPTEAMYGIWQAGAELWVQADQIVVARGAAQSGRNPNYSSHAPAQAANTETIDAWLATAGPNGSRAIELAWQAVDDFKAGTKRVLYLYLESMGVPSVPPVSDLAAWTHLTIRDNAGIDLSSVADFASLTDFAVSGCELAHMPDVVRQLTKLEGLVLGDNPLDALPDWIGELTTIERLGLGKTTLTDLPASLGTMAGLRTLFMNECELVKLPRALTDVAALQELRADANKITVLPPWIAELRTLEVLNLERNQIAAIPASISQLTHLRELKLARNEITEIPGSIAELQNLELLELTGNPLTGLPRELLALPAECRLAVRGGAVPKALAKARTVAKLREVWHETAD